MDLKNLISTLNDLTLKNIIVWETHDFKTLLNKIEESKVLLHDFKVMDLWFVAKYGKIELIHKIDYVTVKINGLSLNYKSGEWIDKIFIHSNNLIIKELEKKIDEQITNYYLNSIKPIIDQNNSDTNNDQK